MLQRFCFVHVYCSLQLKVKQNILRSRAVFHQPNCVIEKLEV